MIELPEAYVLAEQINKTISGKTIMNVSANKHPHKFAWYSGDPSKYHEKLSGKKVTGSNPGTGYTCGGNVEVLCGDMLLIISTPIKYHFQGDKLPQKHQLLIEFEDFSHMSCTVQMWGAMLLTGINDLENGIPKGFNVNKCPDPLTDGFDAEYFNRLFKSCKQNLSAKAFLATEQRIPGLGNGVLQDILFNARIHPKRKLQTMTGSQIEALYKSVRETLFNMAAQGGRDTEKDLFGVSGGYKTILSSKTLKETCPVCGGDIIREAYLGGNIYYCPICQEP